MSGLESPFPFVLRESALMTFDVRMQESQFSKDNLAESLL
jgi:hypothetical protein